MSGLAVIAKIPGVKGAVLGDLDGAYLDAVREADGETIAAEMGFVGSVVLEAGQQLGLGTLSTIVLAGPARASVVVVRGPQVITVLVDPPRALAAVEKSIETSFQEWT
jgi:predicted regulator of Ras-like GTPase activity (Roadblock/LC7/MglB family)